MLRLYLFFTSQLIFSLNTIDQDTITLSVEENFPVNHFVTDLKNIFAISLNTSTKFSMLHTHPYFRLSSSGIISIARKLDCDADDNLCDKALEYCMTKLLIILNNVIIKIVNIIINDLNDNAPQWPATISLTISENAVIGTLINIPPATDLDRTKINKQITYRIIKQTLFFDIVFLPTDEEKQFPKLRLISLIDREINDNIELLILLTDSGEPKLTSQGFINFQILDVNDNYPVFSSHKYVISLRENFPVNSILPLNASAEDFDAGEFGTLSYIHSVSNTDSVRKHFQINSLNGEIRLLKTLDYDSGNEISYTFVLIAHDHGQPALSGSTTVIINIVDVNDERPIISLNKSVKNISLLENNALNQSVVDISVQDLDNGLNGKFNCFLLEHNKFDLLFKQRLSNLVIYQLIAKIRFDKEQQPFVNVTVTCSDLGIPSLTSSKLITVAIIDVNDNSPKFLMPTISFSIFELSPIGTFITKISATDLDEGHNSRLIYHISDTKIDKQSYSPFLIESNGNLFVNQLLDRLSDGEKFNLLVVASDHGSPALSSQLEITITLIDINNCPPVFNKSTFHFTVPEDSSDDLSLVQNPRDIGLIEYSDCDIGENAKLTISIKGSNSKFQISYSGMLQSVAVLDREEKEEYKLTLIAVDGTPNSQTRHTVTGSVVILLTDVNDNWPIFHRIFSFPTKISYKENVKHELIALFVEDKDSGDNAVVDLSIKPNYLSQHFSIDKDRQSVKLNRKLLPENQGSHTLVIIGADRGKPPKSSRMEIQLTIDDSKPMTVQTSFFPNETKEKFSKEVIVIVIAAIVAILAFVSFTAGIIIKCRKRVKPPLVSFEMENVEKKGVSITPMDNMDVQVNFKMLNDEDNCLECQRLKSQSQIFQNQSTLNTNKLCVNPIYEIKPQTAMPDNLISCFLSPNIISTTITDPAVSTALLPFYTCYQHAGDQFNSKQKFQSSNYLDETCISMSHFLY